MKGWTLQKVYVDEGFSAYRREKRPEFERMMAEHDQWDVVIARWLTRLWRRNKDFHVWLGEMTDQGKDLVAIDVDVDTTSATGHAFLSIMMAMAQLESDMTSERVKDSFAQKFESETPWLTRAPLGYQLVGEKGHKILEIDEEEAKIVRYVFDRKLLVKGRFAGVPLMKYISDKKIAEKLREKGHRGKNGGRFEQPQVSNMLSNPVYCGYTYYRGQLRSDTHEAIIDIETFNTIQRSVARHRKKCPRGPLQLGAERIECTRVLTASRAQPVYDVDDGSANSETTPSRISKKQ